MADQKKDPTWKPFDNVEMGKPVRVTLTTAKPKTSGKGKFGEWFLWTAEIQDQKCYYKEKPEEKFKHSGGVVLFPNAKLNESLLRATNGTQEGVVVEIATEQKKGEKGFYNTYTVKVLEEGKTSPSNLTHAHTKVVEHFKAFVGAKQLKPIKEDFLGLCKSQTYGITSDDVAEQLWRVYQENP